MTESCDCSPGAGEALATCPEGASTGCVPLAVGLGGRVLCCEHALTQGGTEASLGSVNWPFVAHQLWNLSVKQLLPRAQTPVPARLGGAAGFL